MYSESAATLDPLPSAMGKPKGPPTPRADYQMPPVWPGKIVMWRPDPSDAFDAGPAVITAVSMVEVTIGYEKDSAGNDIKNRPIKKLVQGRQVALQVFQTNAERMIPKDGVRHRSDPDWTIESGRESGCWFEAPGESLGNFKQEILADLKAFWAKVEELAARVATLEAALTEPKTKK